MASIDPLLSQRLTMNTQEFSDLVQFLRTGLLDERMLPSNTCAHVPAVLPSGAAPLTFEGCP